MEFLKLIFKYMMSAALMVFRVFPMKTGRVLFLNDLSYTYGDSPRFICEYILSHCPERYELVFALRPGQKAPDPRIVTVAPRTLRYFYYAVTSQVLVTNCGGISYLPISKRQLVINTWHGGGAYKKVGLSAFYNRAYVLENKLNARKVTYMLSSARLAKEEFQKAMLIDGDKFLETGLPRNDIFFYDYSAVREKVYRDCGLDPDVHLVLYCPTYRSGEDALNEFFVPRKTEMDVDRLLETLEARFGGRWVLAERAHPKLRDSVVTGSERTINLSGYPDIQELLCAADVVITDYSSLIWDYSHTKRPCFIFADDIVQYQNTRGFYCPIERWPFPIATDFPGLLRNIRAFDQKDYEQKVERHHRELGSFEKGTATRSAFELIDKFCYGK